MILIGIGVRRAAWRLALIRRYRLLEGKACLRVSTGEGWGTPRLTIAVKVLIKEEPILKDVWKGRLMIDAPIQSYILRWLVRVC